MPDELEQLLAERDRRKSQPVSSEPSLTALMAEKARRQKQKPKASQLAPQLYDKQGRPLPRKTYAEQYPEKKNTARIYPKAEAKPNLLQRGAEKVTDVLSVPSGVVKAAALPVKIAAQEKIKKAGFGAGPRKEDVAAMKQTAALPFGKRVNVVKGQDWRALGQTPETQMRQAQADRNLPVGSQLFAGAGNFLGNLATDPLTWMAGGGAAIGKAAAKKVAAKKGAEAGAKAAKVATGANRAAMGTLSAQQLATGVPVFAEGLQQGDPRKILEGALSTAFGALAGYGSVKSPPISIAKPLPKQQAKRPLAPTAQARLPKALQKPVGTLPQEMPRPAPTLPQETAKPPAPSPTPPAKQPHEMTLDEFRASMEGKVEDPLGNLTRNMHRQAVGKAIAEGKPVPQAALRDYTDIAQHPLKSQITSEVSSEISSNPDADLPRAETVLPPSVGEQPQAAVVPHKIEVFKTGFGDYHVVLRDANGKELARGRHSQAERALDKARETADKYGMKFRKDIQTAVVYEIPQKGVPENATQEGVIPESRPIEREGIDARPLPAEAGNRELPVQGEGGLPPTGRRGGDVEGGQVQETPVVAPVEAQTAGGEANVRPVVEANNQGVQGQPSPDVKPDTGSVLEASPAGTFERPSGRGEATTGAKNAVTEGRVIPPVESTTQGGANATQRPLPANDTPLLRQGESMPQPVSKTVEGESVPLTGAKNAVTEAERKALGLPDVDRQTYTSVKDAYEQGRTLVESGKLNPLDIAREVATKPRPLKAEEVGALAFDRARIIQQYDKATADLARAVDANDADSIRTLTAARERLLGELDDNDNALVKGGREQSAAFNARKMMVAQDFSFAGVQQRAKAAKGAPLTAQEQKQLETLTAQLKDAETKLAEAQAKLAEPKPVTRQNRGAPKFQLTDADRVRIDAAKQRIQEKLTRVSAGVDPTVLADVIEIGTVYVQAGVRSLKEWRVQMQTDLPGVDEDTLNAAWRHISVNESREKRLGKQIGEFTQKIASGDFTLPGRPKAPEPTGQVKMLTAQRDALKAKIVREIENARPRTFWEKLSAYQKANLLSSPKGALLDAFSTGVWQVVDNSLMRSLRGSPVEAYHALRGMLAGTPHAVQATVQTFREGYSERQAKRLDLPTHYEMRSIPGKVISAPARVRAGINEGQRAIGESAELYAQAYKEARAEGASNLRQRMAELIADPTEKMQAAMEAYGDEATFTQAPDAIAKSVNNLRYTQVGGARPFEFVIPFFNTVYNLTKTGVQHTPLGFAPLLSKEVRSDPVLRRQAITRGIIGSGIMAMLSPKAMNGEMTGPVPKDTAEAAQFWADNKQPWSIKLFGKWVEYKNFGPFAIPMAMTAGLWNNYEKTGKRGIKDADILRAAGAMAYVPLESTNMFTLEQILKSDPNKVNQIVGSMASTMVPFSSALRTAGNATDEWLRDPQKWYEWVQAGLPAPLPFSRETLPIKMTGGENQKRAIPNPQRGANALLPIQTKQWTPPQQKSGSGSSLSIPNPAAQMNRELRKLRGK